MKKKELRQMYEEGLIDESKYKEELFKLETAPKEKKRKEKRLPKSITEEEFRALYKAVPEKDKISKVAFILSFMSGLRISEIIGQTKGDNKIEPLNKDMIRKNTILIYGKYSKERIVPKPKGWKAWMDDVLPIKRSARALQLSFKKYAKKAKLDSKYTFHSLRHGFATHSLESGMPINQLQVLLGHDNLSTTSVYTKARPEDALKSYEELF